MTKPWQDRILPFAIGVILLLILTFSSFYIYQIINIQSYSTSPAHTQTLVSLFTSDKQTQSEQRVYALELISLLNRQHHASVIIRTRILVISLSFLTGVVISFLGSIFILGKFSESVNINGELKEIKVAVVSASPGIILALLGVVLIAISITTKTSLDVKDIPVYIQPYSIYSPDDATIQAMRDMTMDTASTGTTKDTTTSKPRK
ncbi:hypothetical protein [Hymenobacter coalescens]